MMHCHHSPGSDSIRDFPTLITLNQRIHPPLDSGWVCNLCCVLGLRA